MFLLPFFLNRLFVTAQPSKKHGHELRVVKKFPVTRLQRLPGRILRLDERKSSFRDATRDATSLHNESYRRTRAVRRHGERWDPRANMASEANLVDYTYTHKNIRNMDTLCSDVCSISGSSWPEAVSYSKHDVCCLMCFPCFL